MDPFFAYDANYLIDDKVDDSSLTPRARAPISQWRSASTQNHGGPRQTPLDLRPQRLAGDSAYGAVRLLERSAWWIDDHTATPV